MALRLLLSTMLLLAGLLTHASPPDPSWIPGLYDQGDHDDAVVFLTSEAGVIGPPLNGIAKPQLIVVGWQPSGDERAQRAPILSSNQPRAPPSF